MKILVTTEALPVVLNIFNVAGAYPIPVCMFKTHIPDPSNTGNNREIVTEYVLVGCVSTNSGTPFGGSIVNNHFKIVDPSLTPAAFQALTTAGYIAFVQVVDFED
jgi:hypothetical protein